MVDQQLLTIFVAVTSVAVLIQTGILVGFYFVSTKLSRQLDNAMEMTRNTLGPLENTVASLRTVSSRAVEFSSMAKDQLRQLEQWLKRPAA